MLIQENQPEAANLKWLQLAQELFHLKQLAFSVWKEHTMWAWHSGIRHLLYKQTGYARCDSSNCLYSLLQIKYGFNKAGKKKVDWILKRLLACLQAFMVVLILSTNFAAVRQTHSRSSSTFTAMGIFPLTSVEVALNPSDLHMQTLFLLLSHLTLIL